MRLCRCCARNLPTTEFFVMRARKDGLNPLCKACTQRNSNRPSFRFSSNVCKSKIDGFQWGLGLEEYTELMAWPRYYCGGALPKTGRGLDRIDPTKGYTTDNVVPACAFCNEFKGKALTLEEMSRLGVVVAQIQKERREKGLPQLVGKIQRTGPRNKVEK